MRLSTPDNLPTMNKITKPKDNTPKTNYTPHEALVLAIAHCQNVAANKFNPHFKSKYYGLGELLSEIKPCLAEYGLAIVQHPSSSDNKLSLHTKIYHTSGHEFDMGELSISTAGLNLQATGSALTYLRRYSLSTITGVAMGEQDDDDGNSASYTSYTKPVPKPAAPAVAQAPAITKPLSEYLKLTDLEQKIARDLLIKKGWITADQQLNDISTDHYTALTEPRMRTAFLEAIKSATKPEDKANG